jgi:hypothetical protein
MDIWKLESTKQTPAITLDPDKNQLELKGECYPENVAELSTLIFSHLDKYLIELQDNNIFTVNIELNYFNSSSSKMLMNLFDQLENEVANHGKQIIVNWIYDPENDTAEEFGEEFKEDIDSLTFNLIKK